MANLGARIKRLFTDTTSTYDDLKINHLRDLSVTVQTESQAAREGVLFKAMNTPGTPITATAIATFAHTTPFMYIYNTDATKDVEVVNLRIFCTTAPTGTSALDLITYVDRNGSARLSGTPNGTLLTFNPMYGSATSVCTSSRISVSTALSAAAVAGTTFPHSRLRLRSQIPVVGDVYDISFGKGLSSNVAGAVTNPTTTAGYFPFSENALVIPPGGIALFYKFGAGTTVGMGFEFEVTTIEK